MDNTQLQILNNFKSLFGRYKPVVTQNDRQIKITVGSTTTEVNQPRTRQTQAASTRL